MLVRPGSHTLNRGAAFQLQRTLPAPDLLASLLSVLLLEGSPGLTHLAPTWPSIPLHKDPSVSLTIGAGYMFPILLAPRGRVSPLCGQISWWH